MNSSISEDEEGDEKSEDVEIPAVPVVSSDTVRKLNPIQRIWMEAKQKLLILFHQNQRMWW